MREICMSEWLVRLSVTKKINSFGNSVPSPLAGDLIVAASTSNARGCTFLVRAGMQRVAVGEAIHADDHGRTRPSSSTRRVLGIDGQLVHSSLAESAGQAVEDRFHDVLEERTLSRLDVNVSGHSGGRGEFRHAPENISFVQARP